MFPKIHTVKGKLTHIVILAHTERGPSHIQPDIIRELLFVIGLNSALTVAAEGSS